MNIIIPLGGLGKRFKEDGYNKPKPLINIFGKEMIFYLIDSLNIRDEDNIFIIYNKELNKYNFNTIMIDKYKNKLNNLYLIELNKQTEGATETILYGLNYIKSLNIPKININNKCILLDCDTFYHIDILKKYRDYEYSTNAVVCFKDYDNKAIFSYININNDNTIFDIKEKVKISNYANTGCYCFLNGNILLDYCKKIINENIREINEYYISCVIKEMLKDNYIFKSVLINNSEFSCVGTPLQLKIYCSSSNYNDNKSRFCFDIDNVLFTMPEVYNDYTTVKPIYKNIDYLKFLKNMGHTIILYTSRGMKSYNNNIGLITKNIANITFDTLDKYNIEYDEIYFGKPYANFYIDNTIVNSTEDLEKQFGFYKTNVKERYFNEIKNDKLDIIIKTSENNTTKLNGEIYYYKNIPDEIKKYFPIFINNGENWYSIEKINGITLSYLYVNESLTDDLLKKYLYLFHTIHNLKLNTNTNINTNINIYSNYSNKIKERYNNNIKLYEKYINSKFIYKSLIEYFDNYESNKNGIYGIIHGDAVFSNCLIDQNNNFKLIDMRGILDDKLTIYGDILYDYAKIYQSLIGYDEILFDKIVSNNYKMKLLDVFNSYIKSTLGDDYINIIKMICNSLLFTLLPLHNNEKCNDFYKLIDML